MATKWTVYRKAWEQHKALEQEKQAGKPPTLTRHDTLMVGSSFNEDAAKDLSWRLLYGEVGLVHHGLDKLLGEPEVAAGDDGPLMAGMLHEHRECDDSHIWFAPTNYPIRTTSFLEWWVVVDPSDSQLDQVVSDGPGRCYRSVQEWPTARRNASERDAHLEAISTRGLPISYFRAQWNLLNSRLATEAGEPPLQLNGFVCLRLYTGPMYVKYNAVLRGLPPGLDETPVADLAEQWSQLCLGNRYKVTLHAMTAAIGKLSRLTRVCTVYRGPGGVTPKSFWQSDQFGCVGGVEMALMSCSKDKKEALKYVRRSQAKVLFAVHQGMAARGAEISWLSQFPAENEVIFAPLTALEVESTRIEGSVMVVNIKPGIAKCSLQESSLDEKKRQQYERDEQERLRLQQLLARKHWSGSLGQLRHAQAALEKARTKEALAREARERGQMLRRQQTETKALMSQSSAKEAELMAQWNGAREEAELAEKELDMRRQQALQFDVIAQRARQTERQLSRQEPLLRKLAGRLLLGAMKQHLLYKKLNSTESQLLSSREELRQSSAQLEAAAAKWDSERAESRKQRSLQRMTTVKDLSKAERQKLQAEALFQEREKELTEALEAKQAELERQQRKIAKEKERMEEKLTEKIKKELAAQHAEEIKELRQGIQSKMDEMQKVKRESVR